MEIDYTKLDRGQVYRILLILIISISLVAAFTVPVAAQSDGDGGGTEPRLPSNLQLSPDKEFDSYDQLTNTTILESQVIEVDTGANSLTDIILYKITDSGNEGESNSAVAQELVTKSDGNVVIDTEGKLEGNYALVGAPNLPSRTDAEANIKRTFSIDEERLNVSFAADDVTNDGILSETNIKFDANQSVYPITIHASGALSQDQLKSIFSERDPRVQINYTAQGQEGKTDFDEIGLSPISDAEDYNAEFTGIETGEYNFRFIITNSNAEATDSVEVTEADPNVEFKKAVSQSGSGDIVTIEPRLEDTDRAYFQVGSAESGFIDVIYTEADNIDKPIKIQINTRLLGTDVSVDRVYDVSNVDTFESEMHSRDGISSVPRGFLYGNNGRDLGSFGNYLDELELIDRSAGESRYDQLNRPLQPADYEIKAAGTQALRTDTEGVFEADNGGEPNVALNSKVISLTQPKIDNIATYSAPPANADATTDVEALLRNATASETIQTNNRAVVEVSATGLYGALVDGGTNYGADFDRLDDGTSTQVLANLVEDIDSEQISFEVANNDRPNREPLKINLEASDEDTFVLLDEQHDRFLLVVDTRSDDAFRNGDAPESGTTFDVKIKYDADNENDRFEFDRSKRPYETTPSSENYPYLLQGESISSAASFELSPSEDDDTNDESKTNSSIEISRPNITPQTVNDSSYTHTLRFNVNNVSADGGADSGKSEDKFRIEFPSKVNVEDNPEVTIPALSTTPDVEKIKNTLHFTIDPTGAQSTRNLTVRVDVTLSANQSVS